MINKKTKKKKKYNKKKKTVKFSAKDESNLRKAASKAINNPIIKQASNQIDQNLNQFALNEYINLLATVINSELVSSNSYSPTINKSLLKFKKPGITDLFNCNDNMNLYKTSLNKNELQINVSDNKEKPKCIDYSSKEARVVILQNISTNNKLIPHNIIPPIQKHSNCWFNCFFMSLFVSDKGKKFMRYFIQLMVLGVNKNNQRINPLELNKTLLLFALSINACYNNQISNNSLAYNTNNIIYGIAKSLPRDEGIPSVDEHGNPFYFYKSLISYLEGKETINMIRLNQNKHVKAFYQGNFNKNILPHIIVVTIFDNDDISKPQAEDYDNKKTLVNLKGHEYKLDAVIARDLSKQHFCCCLTINKKKYLFDGAVFSRLKKKNWELDLNKNINWKPNQSSLEWNFMRGYSLLFYYRIN